MNTKLSIVVITRNRPDELKKLLSGYDLDAAIAKRVELIVVDDCSDADNQFAAMQAVSDFHARTGLGGYDYLTDRAFPGGARDRGLELASGEYVWMADGDDLIEWSALPRILDELDARSRLPVLVLDYVSIPTDGPSEIIRFAGHNLKAWELGVMVWHKIIRRDLYGKFRVGCFGEDVDWWMRQCLDPEMDQYRALGVIGYHYRRLAPGSVTAAGEDKTEDMRLRMLDELEAIAKSAKVAKRPQGFIDHLIWLFNQYDERKI